MKKPLQGQARTWFQLSTVRPDRIKGGSTALLRDTSTLFLTSCRLRFSNGFAKGTKEFDETFNQNPDRYDENADIDNS